MSRVNELQLDHETCVLLLPGYVNGRLSSSERRAVQEHTAQCDSCFEALKEAQQIREGLQQKPGSLEDLLSSSAMEKNLAQTLELIDQAEADKAEQNETPVQPKVVKIGKWRGEWQNSSRMIRRLVVAQAACLLVALGAIFVPTQTPLEYQTLSEPQQQVSGSSLEGYQVYRVIFHPASTESKMRSLMNAIEGQIISGPSVGGVYNIAVMHSVDQSSLILQSLRNNPWVKLVEPAVHNDGAIE